MRSLVKTTTVVAAVAVFLFSGLPSEAQEATTIQQSPELKVLQRFIGSWEHQVVKTPEKTTMTGTATMNWILRGRMLEHKIIWSPGNIHALSLLTYDAEKREYREWYFDSEGSVPRSDFRGQWEEATETFTWKGRAANGVTSTGIIRFVDKDTYEWSWVHRDRAGKIFLQLEATVKRK